MKISISDVSVCKWILAVLFETAQAFRYFVVSMSFGIFLVLIHINFV